MMHFYLLLLAADAGNKKPEHVTIAEDELAPAQGPQGNLLQGDIDFVSLLIASLLKNQEQKKKLSSSTKKPDTDCRQYRDAMSCKGSKNDCSWIEQMVQYGGVCDKRKTCSLTKEDLSEYSPTVNCDGREIKVDDDTPKLLELGDMCVTVCQEFAHRDTGYITCLPGEDKGVLFKNAHCDGLSDRTQTVIVTVTASSTSATCEDVQEAIAEEFELEVGQVQEISCSLGTTGGTKKALHMLSSGALPPATFALNVDGTDLKQVLEKSPGVEMTEDGLISVKVPENPVVQSADLDTCEVNAGDQVKGACTCGGTTCGGGYTECNDGVCSRTLVEIEEAKNSFQELAPVCDSTVPAGERCYCALDEDKDPADGTLDGPTLRWCTDYSSCYPEESIASGCDDNTITYPECDRDVSETCRCNEQWAGTEKMTLCVFGSACMDEDLTEERDGEVVTLCKQYEIKKGDPAEESEGVGETI